MSSLVDAFSTNLLSPAVLFFLLGTIAALGKSDLRFPEQFYTALTIYLLIAIGFKGGVAISEAGIRAVWLPALAALAVGALIPLWTYPILRIAGKLKPVDAAAISAHYGSVSAVTFIAATNFLKEANEPYESYAAAFLAVMEAPAIVVGVLLGKLLSRESSSAGDGRMGALIHEVLFGRSIVLLIGGLLVGYLSGAKGLEATAPFFVAPFQGVVALFLLDMGMVAARRFGDLRKVGLFLLGFGVMMPLLHGIAGAWLGHMVGLSLGGATLLAVLAASASYIAAPAAVRSSLPEANPTLYLTSALAVTFPFNITFGLPIYFEIATFFFKS